MVVRQFTFDSHLANQFMQFSYDLYRGDSRWIPPLWKRFAAQLSPGFFFYRKPGNHHQHLLVMGGKKVLARASAFVNGDLRDSDGTPVGSIGFFECVNDCDVAYLLLQSATQWLFDQGITRIWAPMNFDIWHGYRFMTRGFETDPFFPEPYNKPYYPDFVTKFGFSAKQSWNSFTLPDIASIKHLAERSARRYEQVIQKGYRFESFDVKDFNGSLHQMHSLLSRSFSGFLGYTPFHFSEFRDLFEPFRVALKPDFALLCHDRNNELVGFATSFLDLAPAIRSMNGSSSLFARWRFLRQATNVKRTVFYLAGVTPEESAKRSGLGRATMHRILQSTLEQGFSQIVFALIAEGNVVRGSFGGNGARPDREYTLYQLNRGEEQS